MSRAELQRLLGKALADPDFRRALTKQHDETTRPFNLAAGERAALRKLDAETLESMAASLEKALGNSMPVMCW